MTTFSEARAIKAPFPYFGGKRAIAAQVWQRGLWRTVPTLVRGVGQLGLAL